MKKILFLALLLFSCNKSNINWSDIAFEDISTISNDKNIMLYFYADWWGPCKMLDADTFLNQNVANYTNQNFIK